MLRITVLSENTAGGSNLLAEHGLALWIERNQRRFLFDTGQGLVLGWNARVLNIDLDTVDAVILSHGHYDHTGGLPQVLSEHRTTPIYAHPAAFGSKFSVRPNSKTRDIGIPSDAASAVRAHARVISVMGPTDLGEGLYLTGPIPRLNDFEDVGGPFYRDAEGRVPDDLIDDQALYHDGADGVVVILGCAHSGVVNTLDYVRKLTGGKPFRAVIGGMHLVSAKPERVDRTIHALRDYDVATLAPMHCTGPEATGAIRSAFLGACIALPTGATLAL